MPIGSIVRGISFGWLCALGVLVGAQTAAAQKYKPDDPIPASAQGKVLPLQGAAVEIKGLAVGVAGNAQDLNAALKDLGAKTTTTEIRIELSSDVLFDFDKADLLPKAIPELEKVATVLKSYPHAACSIEGHTDNKGLKDYNQKLSERRADSVKAWLVAHGVSSPMTIRGWGATKPIAPNALPNGHDDLAGRQKNRRVEIVVKKS
ncbi:MAG: OmpA family protein [Bryobacteraceae bacterium]|jgi:outer membrane protein OmpA-like peptidoglycan-associated protein